MRRFALAFLLAAVSGAWGCLERPTPDPNVLVVAMPTGPNNLDPRVALDDASQKIHTLIFDSLFDLDSNLRVRPKLAEKLEHPTPTTYVVTLKRGVRFHDGHELTSAELCTRSAVSWIPPLFRHGRVVTGSSSRSILKATTGSFSRSTRRFLRFPSTSSCQSSRTAQPPPSRGNRWGPDRTDSSAMP